jgi:hypothetical protein
VFTVQRAVIPGIALGSSPVPGMLLETQYPGDQLDFQNFSVTFLVQENLDNYLQMYFWILGLGFPSSFNQFNAINNAGVVVDPNVGLLNDASTQRFKSKYNVTSDIMLTIYDAQNNVIATITFINAFPITLSPIELDTTVSVASPITASVDFNYTDIQISAPNSTVISN